MQRALPWLPFLLLLPCGAWAGKNPEGPEFKGRVKTISQAHTDSTRFGNTVFIIRRATTWMYDPQGRLTEVRESTDSHKVPGGNQTAHTVKSYQYHDNGTLARLRTSYTGTPEGDKKSTSEYYYDHEGRRILEIFTPDSRKGLHTLYTLSYDHNGRLASIVTLVENDTTHEFREIGYQKNVHDMEGNIAEVHYKDIKTGAFHLSTSSVYDSRKNVLEKKYYYTDGSLRLKLTYTYDGEGRNTTIVTEQPDGSRSTATYAYEDIDANGNYRRVVSNASTESEPAASERTLEYYP